MKPAMRSLTGLWVTAVGLAMGPACGDDGLGSGPTGGAAGSVATAGLPSAGGTGGIGGTTTTTPVATGGMAGRGGSGGNVNTYTCPRSYPSGATETCLDCQPLPAGSPEGCGVPTRCGDTDTSSPTHYPVECHIVFPWRNTTYYPDYLEEAVCYVGADGLPRWQCLL